MARSPRSSKISDDEITIAHLWSQTVQQMFLLGKDEVSGQDFSHRKDWVIDIMAHQSMFMAVDILRFAVMDNHVHFLLRTRPDIVRGWTDQEVAWNYLFLCPKKKRKKKVDGKWEYETIEPSQCEVDALANDPNEIKKIRKRLSSLSFWMQLLKQKVARRANSEVQKDDVCKGAFWKGRFEMTVINTREHLLTCSVYIDLNPFRAKMTDKLEGYPYTSIYLQLVELFGQMLQKGELTPTEENPLGEFPEYAMLSPIHFVERDIQVSAKCEDGRAKAREHRKRCSDTGFLEITAEQYCELVDWSMKQLTTNKQEAIGGLDHAVISSHGMSVEIWSDRLRNFRRMYRHEAGVSRRKIYEGFCCNPTPAMLLALRDVETVGGVVQIDEKPCVKSDTI